MSTLNELKSLIQANFGIEPESMKPDTPLADYGIDSLSLAELVFSIEDHFKLDFPDTRTDISTLSQLSVAIDELRALQPA